MTPPPEDPPAPPIRRKAVRKEETIRLRCTTEQKRLLTEAAEAAGMGISGWLLYLGLREVRNPKP